MIIQTKPYGNIIEILQLCENDIGFAFVTAVENFERQFLNQTATEYKDNNFQLTIKDYKELHDLISEIRDRVYKKTSAPLIALQNKLYEITKIAKATEATEVTSESQNTSNNVIKPNKPKPKIVLAAPAKVATQLKLSRSDIEAMLQKLSALKQPGTKS